MLMIDENLKETDLKYRPACRKWIFDGLYVGGYFTATVAGTTDARGSLIVLSEAVSVATGHPSLGGSQGGRGYRVGYLNFYYCLDVIEEAIWAMLESYGVDSLGDNLFVSDNEKSLDLLPYEFGDQHVQGVIEMVKALELDVVILDRFSPDAFAQERGVYQVGQDLKRLATETGAAVHLVIHGVQKPNYDAIRVARVVRSLQKSGDGVKAVIRRSNLSQSKGAAKQYRFIDVVLPNGEQAGVAQLVE